MEKEDLKKLFKLNHVPRWSIIDMRRSQSVAEHTFRVMVIVQYMTERLGDSAQLPSLMETMVHDMEEAYTGDTPSPHKNGGSYQIGDQTNAQLFLQLADTIEARIWLRRYGVRPDRVDEYLCSKITKILEKLRYHHGGIDQIVNEIFNVGLLYD